MDRSQNVLESKKLIFSFHVQERRIRGKKRIHTTLTVSASHTWSGSGPSTHTQSLLQTHFLGGIESHCSRSCAAGTLRVLHGALYPATWTASAGGTTTKGLQGHRGQQTSTCHACTCGHSGRKSYSAGGPGPVLVLEGWAPHRRFRDRALKW